MWDWPEPYINTEMPVYLTIPLPKTPYVHRMYMVLVRAVQFDFLGARVRYSSGKFYNLQIVRAIQSVHKKPERPTAIQGFFLHLLPTNSDPTN
jgi:hypothetical protein